MKNTLEDKVYDKDGKLTKEIHYTDNETITILNENNYSDEDNIIIIRTLLSRLKRLVKERRGR